MTGVAAGLRSAAICGPASAWCAAGGTAVVGDAETVAARVGEYQEIGIDTSILSGYPTPIRLDTGPFGETIANEHRPLQKAAP